jgi:cysteine-rich repeat protein
VIRTYTAPSLQPGDHFGTSLSVTDGLLVVGAPGTASGAGRAYVFDLESGLLIQPVVKPMPQRDDALGTAVALANGRIFVGAPGDDAGTIGGGAVHVFDGQALVAVLRERLSLDELGAAAVAAADGGFYVGAPGADYVVRIDPGATVASPPIGSPGLGENRFGSALAVLGDTLVVGAPETAGPAGERVGAVHLFDGGMLSGTIQNPSPGAGDEFGFAVGTLGADVLASAPSAGDADTGLAYRLDLTGRLKVTYGKPAPTAGDFFGAALAGDQGQVLVGVPFDASGGDAVGAVYLFDGDSSAIVAAIPNPSGARDLFGASVALGQWIVVGAPLAADGLGAVGTVWVFDRATGALVRRLENPRGGSFDGFGASVALNGDDLIVGAPGGDDGVGDAGFVYVFEASTGQLLQTFRNPPQTSFDHFGSAVAANAAGILIGSAGSSRVYLFAPIVPSAGFLLRAAAPLVALATSDCGNGLVEPGEACDDGNAIDTDDCRNDCTPGLCCTLDALADAGPRCDDGDPCTTDILDPVAGCRYESSGAPGCCQSDADCDSGQCRVCVGCFIYHWDCCAQGSSCVPSNPECAAKTCIDAAHCQCQGKLDCGDEAMPEVLKTLFGDACETLRLQSSVSGDGTFNRADLVLARQGTRHARASLRKTLRMARKLTRQHTLSRTCRQQITAQVKVVRQAIPKGKKLRRCLLTPTS